MDEKNLHLQLLELQQKYIRSVPDRLQILTEEITQLRAGQTNSAPLKQLYRLTHSLKGSAGTFDQQPLSDAASRLEQQLQHLLTENHPVDQATINQLSEQLRRMRNLPLKDTSQEHTANTSDSACPVPLNSRKNMDSRTVYVIEDDQAQADEIGYQLTHFNYQVKTFQTLASARSAINQQLPDALLVDICLAEGMLAGPDFVDQSQQFTAEQLPLIFISTRSDWKARYAAACAGGRAYLTKPLDFTRLTETLDELLLEEGQEPLRVLIIDDDLLLANHFKLVLQQAGIQAEVVSSANKVLSAAAKHQPELILLDLHMGEISGLDVAQVIRQHQELFSTPIIFISSEKNLRLQYQALLQGDHFLEKPVPDSFLVDFVLSQGRRSRHLAAMMYHDGLTGLLNQITLTFRLESELANADRQNKTLHLVMLDLDNFKQVNDNHGHGVGDRVLKSLARLLKDRLRKSDHVGRLGGEEFAFILPDTTTEQALTITEELRAHFNKLTHNADDQEFHCSFSAGIVSSALSHDGNQLLEAADMSLYQAKHQGRNQSCVYHGQKE